MNHEEAHRHLSASDKRLAALIARSHRYNIEPNLKVRPFDALAESIAYQQLSGKAAATIWKRVRAIFPKRKFLDPKLVLETLDEKLRAAGLSRSKVAALKDLAAKTIEGTVPTGRALAKNDRRRDYRAFDSSARDRALDRGDAFALRFGKARCLAGARLRSAQRLRENLRQKKTADAETDGQAWAEVCAVSLRAGLVLLAGAG